MRATASFSSLSLFRSFLSTSALLLLASIAQADDCSSLVHPRKQVVCYFEGKRHFSSLNSCLCTHLIVTSIGIDENANLHISKAVRRDIDGFRTQNPRLRIITSLGGEAVKGSAFSSLIRDNEALSNLTASINSLRNEGVIDGIEIDWEWPVQTGEKKDRVKLIRYARQIKIAVGEEVIMRRPRFFNNRQRREAPIEEIEEELER